MRIRFDLRPALQQATRIARDHGPGLAPADNRDKAAQQGQHEKRDYNPFHVSHLGMGSCHIKEWATC